MIVAVRGPCFFRSSCNLSVRKLLLDGYIIHIRDGFIAQKGWLP